MNNPLASLWRRLSALSWRKPNALVDAAQSDRGDEFVILNEVVVSLAINFDAATSEKISCTNQHRHSLKSTVHALISEFENMSNEIVCEDKFHFSVQDTGKSSGKLQPFITKIQKQFLKKQISIVAAQLLDRDDAKFNIGFLVRLRDEGAALVDVAVKLGVPDKPLARELFPAN